MAADTVNIGGREYPFIAFGGAGGSMLTVNDTAAPYLAHLAKTFPGEFSRALRHVGWWLRQELKDAAYKGGVAGVNWPPLTTLHKLRVLDRAKAEDMGGRMRRGLTPWHFGHIAKAIGYKYEPGVPRVRIGWLSRSSARLGAMVQAGFSTPVTPKMRRFFWAVGARPPAGNVIASPARPLVFPMFLATRGEVLHRIELRVYEYLTKGRTMFGGGAAA
ncbi:MAG: hypothetical protein ACOZHQ_09450 [Thermodesulfobacteriota bacterium]